MIVTYLSEDTIERCIESVYSEFPEAKICVYDNASNDRSVELIKRRFNKVRVIEGDENIGFARGINRASSELNSDFLIVLNPDCFLNKGFGSALARAIVDYPYAGVYVPLVFDDDNQISPYCRRNFPAPVIIIFETLGITYRLIKTGEVRRYLMLNKPMEKQYVDVCSGACFVIKKGVFDEVGGFDEDFFLLGEDVELCFRLWRKGYKMILIPGMNVVHLKGVSREKVPFLVAKTGGRSMIILAKKMGMSLFSIFVRTIYYMKIVILYSQRLLRGCFNR